MTSDTDDEFLSASEGEYEENSGKNKRILKESFDAHNCCTQRICCDLKKEEDCPKKAPSSENEVTQNIIEEIVEPTISKESKYNGHSDVLDLLNGKIEENIGGWEEFNVEPTSGGEMNSGNNYCVTTKPDEIISNKIGSETHLNDVKELSSSSSSSSDVVKTKGTWDDIQKVESNSELDIDSSAWDEWGDEKKEDVKGGWDDWSLIGDGTIKQVEQNESFYRQELSQSSLTDEGIKNATSLGSKKEKNNDSLWGWSGLVNAVGDTFSSAIESTLGFPLPEEMAQRCVESEKKLRNQVTTVQQPHTPITTTTSNQSSAFSSFGVFSGLVSGGIDVLESIGKKTFETITVTDPNRNGRRRMIFDNSSGQNLSDVLKELKIRQEIEQPRDVIHGIVPKAPVDVATFFERSEGMAHLEALELLSTNRVKAPIAFERQFTLALEEVDVDDVDSDNFQQAISKCLKEINLPYDPKNILACDQEIHDRIKCSNKDSEDELFKDAVTSLVDFTALAVQMVAKLANLMLAMGERNDFTDFIQLYSILGKHITSIALKYTETIGTKFEASSADDLSTQVLIEASTAIDFIRQAHKLLIPMFVQS